MTWSVNVFVLRICVTSQGHCDTQCLFTRFFFFFSFLQTALNWSRLNAMHCTPIQAHWHKRQKGNNCVLRDSPRLSRSDPATPGRFLQKRQQVASLSKHSLTPLSSKMFSQCSNLNYFTFVNVTHCAPAAPWTVESKGTGSLSNEYRAQPLTDVFQPTVHRGYGQRKPLLNVKRHGLDVKVCLLRLHSLYKEIRQPI